MREWLRRLGKLSWLLVIVPLVAAGAAVGYGFVQEPDYTQTATATLSSPEGGGGAALSGAASSFTDAALSEDVLKAASKESGISETEIEESTTAGRVGESPQVEITYTGPRHGDSVETMLRSQVTAAVDEVYEPSLRTANARVTAAEARVDSTEKVLDDLRDKTGYDQPTEDYKAKASEVSQLKVAVINAESNDEPTDSLEASLAEAESEMKKLARVSAKFEGPLDEASKAREGLQQARTDQDDLKARKASAITADAISVSDLEQDDKLTAALRLGVSALVVAFGLVVVLLVVVTLLRRKPERGSNHTARHPGRVEEQVR